MLYGENITGETLCLENDSDQVTIKQLKQVTVRQIWSLNGTQVDENSR